MLRNQQIFKISLKLQKTSNVARAKENETLQVEFQTLEIESDIIKCKYCEFSTNSAKGLKTHMKRKHTVKKKEEAPSVRHDLQKGLPHLGKL